jgi:hypothetical protein
MLIGYEGLSFLIGKWNTKGEVIKTSVRPVKKISGTDSYEWILRGAFILHRVNVMMGDVRTEVLEFIGEYDSATQLRKMCSFDNTGAMTTMLGSIKNDGVFEIKQATMKSTLTAAKDGKSMKAFWESWKTGIPGSRGCA